MKWMRQYGKVYGLYYCLEPILTIMEPELIRTVMISNFPNFVNRRPTRTFHQVWNQNLFLSENDDWKRIRTLTTPSFTTGKLKSMNRLMLTCVDKLDTYFQKVTGKALGEAHPIELRQVFSGFTIDVIASTAFATETNANNPDNRVNEFVVQGLDLFRFPPINIMGLLAFPRWVNDLIGVRSFFRDEPLEWFVTLTSKIVSERKKMKNQDQYQDLVQLMLDAYVDEQEVKDGDYNRLTATGDSTNINGMPQVLT